jgi:hypothetical protein
MSERQRERVQVKAVSMYPTQWTIVHHFSQEQGYGSTSAALRRIVDEWQQMKSTRPSGVESGGGSMRRPGAR